MSHCKLRTPRPIHFKLRIVIGITIWWIKSHNSGMKNLNFTKSIQTIRLSIPTTVRSLKWIGQGVLNLQCDGTYYGIPMSDCPSVRFTCHALTWPIHFKFHSYWNWWSYGVYTLWWNFEFSFQSYGTLFIRKDFNNFRL
jgi:hypothetical protein